MLTTLVSPTCFCASATMLTSDMACRAAENGELFSGKVPEGMRKMEQFETRFMAAAAQDNSADLSATAGVLSEAFGMDAASIDLADLQEVGTGSLLWLTAANNARHRDILMLQRETAEYAHLIPTTSPASKRDEVSMQLCHVSPSAVKPSVQSVCR